MRFRTIWEYIKETLGNTNKTILKQLINEYVESQNNELSNFTIDANIADNVDLLGKKCSDLQKDIVIDDGKVTGTLKYVKNYTGFSGLSEEQQGYYLALHFAHKDADIIKVNGVTLDEDGIHIVRFVNPRKNNKRVLIIELIDESENLEYTDYINIGSLDFE